MVEPTGETGITGTTPYAWPFDGAFDPQRSALLVVLPADLAYTDLSSAADPTEALTRIGALAVAAREAGVLVVEVTTTVPNRPGRVVAPVGRTAAIGVRQADFRIFSGGVDGFFSSTLDAVLRTEGRDHLLLCGQWLELGVHSTMRSANDRGYECLLILDACVPWDEAMVPAARSQIEMSGGIFGAVGDGDAVLHALDTAPLRADAPLVVSATR